MNSSQLNASLESLFKVVEKWKNTPPLLSDSLTIGNLQLISNFLSDIYQNIKLLSISDIIETYSLLGVFLANLSTISFLSIDIQQQQQHQQQHKQYFDISKQTLNILLLILNKSLDNKQQENVDNRKVKLWVSRMLHFRIYQNDSTPSYKDQSKTKGDKDPNLESMYQFMNSLGISKSEISKQSINLIKEELNSQVINQNRLLSLNFNNDHNNEIQSLIFKIDLFETSNQVHDNSISLSLLDLLLSQKQQQPNQSVINCFLAKNQPTINIAIWKRYPIYLFKEIINIFKKYYAATHNNSNITNQMNDNGMIESFIEYPFIFQLTMEFLEQLWIETQSFQVYDFIANINILFIKQRLSKSNYIDLNRYYPISLKELIYTYQGMDNIKFNNITDLSKFIGRINEIRITLISNVDEEKKLIRMKEIWFSNIQFIRYIYLSLQFLISSKNQLDLELINYIVWFRYPCIFNQLDQGYIKYVEQFQLLFKAIQSYRDFENTEKQQKLLDCLLEFNYETKDFDLFYLITSYVLSFLQDKQLNSLLFGKLNTNRFNLFLQSAIDFHSLNNYNTDYHNQFNFNLLLNKLNQ